MRSFYPLPKRGDAPRMVLLTVLILIAIHGASGHAEALEMAARSVICGT